ncbi:hypothetical protein L6164_011435 [Bauhinia variegata]|uniref:Uncharacterized protein n=1 Tax=Bauhinia variegata TaxID=167791 RepID=A0ACB9P887_BAUVA|nr:hypothetical protein L6164_011435 [Bauhinia variegata]
MSNFSDELQHVKALISSEDKSNRSLGYSTLFHFQQLSADNPSFIQSLAQCSQTLVHSIVSDVSDDDEEIAAQALKSLGFMIYHPSIVATLQVDDATLVLESLAQLITTTKLKSVCNLGVWCISVQQLDASFLATHYHSLLRAILHALDNPMGSLSTTFEAIQAIVKLAAQLNDQMRDSSHIWAPSIYRRLISIEKKERDASESCLLKIRSTIIPPSLDLSKVLIRNLKEKLLNGMKDLIDQGMKVQAIRAWGWFVRMLGSCALKNRHLVNDMLKIPERTLTDLDPQVQIATQVAWEGLIDALVHCPISLEKNTPVGENSAQQKHSLERKNCDIQANGFPKIIKLIMTPLIGIMSNKCDTSVKSSCFNTWCYLLHKLDISVNEPWVITMVLEPILKAIFQNGPDSKNIWLWKACLSLLTDSISHKRREVDCQSIKEVRPRICEIEPSISKTCSWKQHPIRWLPWDISQLDFYLGIVFVLIRQASMETVSPQHRRYVYDDAVKLFISLLRGVKLDLESQSTNYDGIMCCLNSLLMFMKRVCEDLYLGGCENDDPCCIAIQFIDAITRELGPSVLGSPLYRFALDLKYIANLQSSNVNEHLKFLSVSCISYMDKVSPMVYLIALYFHMMVQSTMEFPQSDCTIQGRSEYFKFIFSSNDPLENILVCTGLLYKHIQPRYLNIWITVAQGLKDCVHDAKCKSLLEAMSDSAGYSSVCHLLFHPLVATSELPRLTLSNASASSEKYLTSPERNVSLECIIQTWKSLYGYLCASKLRHQAVTDFSNDLCSMLSGWCDEIARIPENGTDINFTCKDMDPYLLYLSGNFLICILEQVQTSELIPETGRSIGPSDSNSTGDIKASLKLAVSYMNLLRIKMVSDPLPGFVVISRVFYALACFLSSLNGKIYIFLFLEIVSCQLLQWLSNMEMQDQITNDQLRFLWTETLGRLRSHPPLNLDSALLKRYEPLFEKTLDHPYPSISEPTIDFWNSTFGQQTMLDIPPSLLPVLDKLSRNGKLKLQKRSLPFLRRCHSHAEANNTLHGYRVTATHNMTSKRVGLMLDNDNHPAREEGLTSSLKRKRLELTEHQKEVRRAQQGRVRDCGGHGPGVRTYTDLDFSQGFEDSQDSQEIRDSEAILQMLRKAI